MELRFNDVLASIIIHTFFSVTFPTKPSHSFMLFLNSDQNLKSLYSGKSSSSSFGPLLMKANDNCNPYLHAYNLHLPQDCAALIFGNRTKCCYCRGCCLLACTTCTERLKVTMYVRVTDVASTPRDLQRPQATFVLAGRRPRGHCLFHFQSIDRRVVRHTAVVQLWTPHLYGSQIDHKAPTRRHHDAVGYSPISGAQRDGHVRARRSLQGNPNIPRP